MNSNEEIVIEIDEEAKTKITAKNFSGRGCVEATKPFEEALGKVSSDVKTADYNKTASTKNQLGQK